MDYGQEMAFMAGNTIAVATMLWMFLARMAAETKARRTPHRGLFLSAVFVSAATGTGLCFYFLSQIT